MVLHPFGWSRHAVIFANLGLRRWVHPCISSSKQTCTTASACRQQGIGQAGRRKCSTGPNKHDLCSDQALPSARHNPHCPYRVVEVLPPQGVYTGGCPYRMTNRACCKPTLLLAPLLLRGLSLSWTAFRTHSERCCRNKLILKLICEPLVFATQRKETLPPAQQQTQSTRTTLLLPSSLPTDQARYSDSLPIMDTGGRMSDSLWALVSWFLSSLGWALLCSTVRPCRVQAAIY